MPHPATAERPPRDEPGRPSRSEWARDAVDALVAGLLLTAALLTLLG